MVVLCVVFDIFSSIWKMLAATNLVSDSMFAYWDSRIVLPISEGIMFLPVAMVVSVWVDVANSTMSRLKVSLTEAHLSFWDHSPDLQALARHHASMTTWLLGHSTLM